MIRFQTFRAFLIAGMAWACAEPLRLATYNLEWLTGSATENRLAPWRSEAELETHRENLARVLAVLVRADIICVQEVTSRIALEKLAEEPPLKSMGYRVYHLESEDTFTGQDVAFLARIVPDRVDGAWIRRFPRRSQEVGTPRPGRRQGATVILSKHAVMYFTVGKLKLGILGLHLLAHPDDVSRARKRNVQAKIAARIVRDAIVSKGYVPVVLGDLNDLDPDCSSGSDTEKPRDRALRILKDFDARKSGEELFNAAERMQPVSERYSTYRDLNHDGRRERDEPVSLLDHILLDQSLSARLRRVEIIHQPADASASDHWPVVVELER